MSDVQIDYLSRDYAAIRADLLERAELEIPEWTNTGPADFAVILLELFAHAADISNYYIDRVSNEAFVQSAALRSSILNLASMLDYRPSLRTAAATSVTFTKAPGQTANIIVIPEGTVVLTSAEFTVEPIYFTTIVDTTIPGGSETVSVGVVEGTIVTETLGSSAGTLGQRYTLYNSAVIEQSYTVEIDEGVGVVGAWTWENRLIDVGPDDNVFTTFTDEHDVTQIIFGDGVFGRIPPVGSIIRATYRYGVGLDGNVAAGAISTVDPSFISYDAIQAVTNATPATGGSNPESIETLRRNIPLSARALDRAVTVEDFGSLALNVPQVAKANAQASYYTTVTVSIAPSGGGAPATALKNTVKAYLEERAMIGSSVVMVDPTYKPVAVTATIQVLPKYLQVTVKRAIEDKLAEFFAFDARSFGERITIGDFYRQVLSVTGVDYVATLNAWNIDGSGAEDFTLSSFEIASAGVITLTMTGGLT